MKNKTLQTIFAAITLACLAGSLVACGSTINDSADIWETAAADDYAYRATETNSAALYSGEIFAEETYDMPMAAEATAADEADGGGVAVPDEDRKIIMNASVSIEALEYEESTAAVERAINAQNGYISQSGVYNSQIGYRSADYTVRVPAANYRAFLSALEETGNMVSRSESSEDVTTQYIDIEARLTSLRAQETRLMELMGEAGDLESLILVQQQLSEVQYQIEYYEGLQRNYDRQIAYSTVNIHLYEVVEYTEPEPEGYFSQLGQAFRGGWNAALRVVQAIGIGLVGGLPLILMLAAAAVVLVILLRRSRKRSRARLDELQKQNEANSLVAQPVASAPPPASAPTPPADAPPPEAPDNQG